MRLPDEIDYPGPTMVLAGEDRDSWERILPHLVPLAVYRVPSHNIIMVRWRLTYDASFRLGLGPPRCSEPGCGCDEVIEDSLGYIIDTDFKYTGFYFDEMPWEFAYEL